MRELSVSEASNFVYVGLRYSCAWMDVPASAIAETIARLEDLDDCTVVAAVVITGLRYGKVDLNDIDSRLGRIEYAMECFWELPATLRAGRNIDVAFLSSDSLN